MHNICNAPKNSIHLSIHPPQANRVQVHKVHKEQTLDKSRENEEASENNNRSISRKRCLCFACMNQLTSGRYHQKETAALNIFNCSEINEELRVLRSSY